MEPYYSAEIDTYTWRIDYNNCRKGYGDEQSMDSPRSASIIFDNHVFVLIQDKAFMVNDDNHLVML